MKKIVIIILLNMIIFPVFSEPTREPSQELIEVDIPVPPQDSKGFDFSQVKK